MVLAAHHMGDLRVDIVDHARQGVEVGAVAADQDGIGDRRRVDRLGPAHQVIPVTTLARQLEPPVRAAALRFEGFPLGVGELQRGPVIDRRTPP